MTDTFSVYAFTKQDEHGERDVRRAGIPIWRLAEAVGWAVGRGHDTILVELTGEPASSTRLSTHHLCNDPHCPGGCE